MAPEPVRRSMLHRALPFAWLAMSATWAAVILVTDHLAGPLALWIATTVGPLTTLERQHRRRFASPDAMPGVRNAAGTPSAARG